MSAERSLQAIFLTDDSGNIVGVVLDGSIYRLQTIGKLLNVAGTQIDPSTEDKQDDIITELTSIKSTAGIKKITDALPAGTNLLGKATLSQGGNDATVNASNRLLVDALLASGGADQPVKLVDSTGTYTADVTTAGRLKVEEAPITTPPATTAVESKEVGTISAGNYKNYSIPTGETVTIQQFVAGCSGEEGKGARVRLIYDQGSGEPVQNLEIARLYVKASTAILPVDYTVPRVGQSGDRIRIHRFPLEGSTQEIYGYWKGYY